MALRRELAGLAAGLLCLLLPAGTRAESAPVAVTVKDSSGASLAGATVALLDAQRAAVASARADASGRVSFTVPPGTYLIAAGASGFAEHRQPLRVGSAGSALEITLSPAPLAEELTITASPGLVQHVDAAAQQVNVISGEEIGQRAQAVLAQAVAEEVGVHLQRTSPTIGGVFVRGMTGNKVSVFVDGVRYSTGAARGGINTFFNLNEPSSLDGVEVLRGPSSAQYGSDAIGGSVQLLSHLPSVGAGGDRFSGTWNASGGSADASFGSSLRADYAGERLALSASLSGRRVNRLRPGGGLDSHNAVTRFFGLDSDLVIDERLPDTAFTQYGGSLRAAWSFDARTQLIASYTRGQQDGGRRYDQLLGGDGNLVADLRNLMLDFGYLKLDRRQLGPFDQLTLAYSFNSQREERVNQGGNGNPRASINHEPERTTVHGFQASAQKYWRGHALGLGGDAYLEHVTSPSFSSNPGTGTISTRRGRVPDGARFRSGGVYLQDVFQASRRLTLSGSLRWNYAAYQARAADSPLVGGRPLWPDDSLTVSSPTFRAGAVLELVDGLALSAGVGRGYRAPHITDLGTLGLTGAGFEVAGPEIEALGGTLGTTADAAALSSGIPVSQQQPEESLSFEAALRLRRSRFDFDLAAFRTDVDHNITKQALILPAGSVGVSLGDQTVSRQDPSGVVYVPVSSNPVLVRANSDDARIWGLEATLNAKPAAAWTVAVAATYLHAEDKRTGLPPNLEGGTPAPDGWLKIRYAPGEGRRLWVEPYLHLALAQDRLSSLDLGDRRTGAGRSRSSIASFFNNGARARGLIGDGPDGRPGTADDVLLATGETLAQVQTRVLGDAGSAPLYTEVEGYAVLGLRGSLRFGAHEVFLDLQNLGDRNYRGVSWGVDAPGRGVYLSYRARF
ncbi:MAG TPA: TonB-dependent receptor [Vicinamibacteria bacterium]|nr:TonB-dependent receptor [Vicinamibacteria bacterium]